MSESPFRHLRTRLTIPARQSEYGLPARSGPLLLWHVQQEVRKFHHRVSSAPPNVFRLVSHMLAALFNNRSAFRREWQRFESAPAKPNSVEGRWTGEWVSDISGHRGELKCVLAPMTAGKYRAFFHAGFSKFFRVAYATELELQQNDGFTTLTGQKNLGSLAGGIYRCEGEIRGTDFNCKYSCKYDQGIFRLRRVV